MGPRAYLSIQHRGMEAAGIGFLDDSGAFAMIKGPLKAEDLHKRSCTGTRDQPNCVGSGHEAGNTILGERDEVPRRRIQRRGENLFIPRVYIPTGNPMEISEEENYLDALSSLTGTWSVSK